MQGHSPSPQGQPAPAHQTCDKLSDGVNWHGFISQLSTPTAGHLHDSSFLLAKTIFQEGHIALGGHVEDRCLCSSFSSFSLGALPILINIKLQQYFRVSAISQHNTV